VFNRWTSLALNAWWSSSKVKRLEWNSLRVMKWNLVNMRACSFSSDEVAPSDVVERSKYCWAKADESTNVLSTKPANKVCKNRLNSFTIRNSVARQPCLLLWGLGAQLCVPFFRIAPPFFKGAYPWLDIHPVTKVCLCRSKPELSKKHLLLVQRQPWSYGWCLQSKDAHSTAHIYRFKIDAVLLKR